MLSRITRRIFFAGMAQASGDQGLGYPHPHPGTGADGRRQGNPHRRRLFRRHSPHGPVLRRVHAHRTSKSPTRPGQDLFILSKGHAVAALASIYADLGYLWEGRAASIPAAQRASSTGIPAPCCRAFMSPAGPEGHGLSVCGRACAGAAVFTSAFDVFCLTGDGELQAGMIWEGVMYAGARHLDNLCVLVDKNEGQLDNPRALVFPMPDVGKRFESFGWNAFEVDATGYEGVVEALERFKHGTRGGPADGDRVQHQEGLGRLLQLHGGAQSGAAGGACEP